MIRKFGLTAGLLILSIYIYCQEKNYPGIFEFRNYKIGDILDTTGFVKHKNLYYPNCFNGWTIFNINKPPRRFKNMPVAIWILKSDSSLAFTLLDRRIVNIIVSKINDSIKTEYTEYLTDRFKKVPNHKEIIKTHPMQEWISYWNLYTWNTKNVIIQIGDMGLRKRDKLVPDKIYWSLIYSDFILEKQIIEEYKEKITCANKVYKAKLAASAMQAMLYNIMFIITS